VSSGISSAVNYKFKVRARNKWGWGQWSQIVSIRASTWPTVVAKPSTSIELSTGNVLITWIAPLHRGSSIEKYVIEFQNQANLAQWVEILDYCNGQLVTIVLSRTCSVPMSKFISNVLNYTIGLPIIVRITAHNEKGYSETPSLSSDSVADARWIP